MAAKAFFDFYSKTDGCIFQNILKGERNNSSRREKTNYYNWKYHLWFSKAERNERHRKDCFSMSFNILLPPILVRNEKFMKTR